MHEPQCNSSRRKGVAIHTCHEEEVLSGFNCTISAKHPEMLDGHL